MVWQCMLTAALGWAQPGAGGWIPVGSTWISSGGSVTGTACWSCGMWGGISYPDLFQDCCVFCILRRWALYQLSYWSLVSFALHGENFRPMASFSRSGGSIVVLCVRIGMPSDHDAGCPRCSSSSTRGCELGRAVRDIRSVTLHMLSPTKLGLCLSFFSFISFINSYLYEFITHYV